MKKRQIPVSLTKVVNRDFDLAFRYHPSTGKLLMKKDDECVKQAIKNLILTDQNERPFRPNFGGNIRRRLFDLHTTVTRADFQNLIENTIKNYEPRAILNNNSVSVLEFPDDNTLKISIKFRNSITLNDLQLDINLNRVR
jgi:phage baseplate assembly protein W